MAIIVDIEKAEERAQRALDGMTYNRDQMARDTLGMAAELRNWRKASVINPVPRTTSLFSFVCALNSRSLMSNPSRAV